MLNEKSVAMARRIKVLTAILGFLIVLAYFTTPPDPFRPRAGEHRGLDVSAHQGLIDWQKVAEAGWEFAYIKASEGGDWVDERFFANWEGAAASGLRRGAYHFFTLRRPGSEQAANFLNVAAPDGGALPPVVDLEFAGQSLSGPLPSREVLVRELGVFAERVEKAWGRPLILYLDSAFQKHYQVRQAVDREIWIRKLYERPSKDTWRLWQFSDQAMVPGIQGGVDVDLMKY